MSVALRLTAMTAGVLLFVYSNGCQHAESATPKTDNQVFVLEGASLIDGTGAVLRENTAIFIQGDRITKVGNVTDKIYPDGATVLDLRGRYILPGFIDTHVHLAPDSKTQQQTLRTLLAFGITTIRNAGATPETGIKLRDKIARGDVSGPRMLTAGRFINARASRWQESVAVKTEAEIREEVRRQIASGVDFIKLQRGLSPDMVEAAVEEAHAHGIKVIGHLLRTSWIEAALSGIDALCHINWDTLFRDLIPQQQRDELLERHNNSSKQIWGWRDIVKLDNPQMNDLIAVLLKNRTEVNPTLIRAEVVSWGDDLGVLENLEPRYAPEANLSDWWWGRTWSERHPYSRNLSQKSLDELKAMFSTILKTARIFHDRGILITAGTDVGNPWITPGVSLHRELQLLVRAGITPLEVIGIATRNGAKALGISDEVGTVEEGKVADLVILTANPLDDIRNSRKIEFVIKSGRRLEPAFLLEESLSEQADSTKSRGL